MTRRADRRREDGDGAHGNVPGLGGRGGSIRGDVRAALFAEWAPHLCDLAGVGPGSAFSTWPAGPASSLAWRPTAWPGRDGRRGRSERRHARRRAPRPARSRVAQGDAEALPFPRASFDRVLCQMALMFFPDRARALREMRRVTAPGVSLAARRSRRAWTTSPRTDRSSTMASAPGRPRGRSLLSAYFACGDLPGSTGLARIGGPARHADADPRRPRVRLRSMRSWPPRSRARR